MTTIEDSSRPQRADARRNRGKVLDAARETFTALGPAAGMDAVAARAGVGMGTVYRHFPTKQTLLDALSIERFAALADEAEVAVGSGGDLFAVLRVNAASMATELHLQSAVSDPVPPWLSPAAPEFARLEDALAQLVARGIAGGSLRADLGGADVRLIMGGLCTTMGWGGDWRRHLELALDGLRAR